MVNRVLAVIILFSVLLGGCVERVPDYLSELDHSLSSGRDAAGSMIKRADSLATMAGHAGSPTEKFTLLMETADLYSQVDLRKALELTIEAKRLAENEDCGPNAATYAAIRLASLYNGQGNMTREAEDIFDTLDRTAMDSAALLSYYVLGVQINRTLAGYAIDPQHADLYLSRTSAYRDSVLSIDPARISIAANRYIDRGQPEKAVSLLSDALPGLKRGSSEEASLSYILAQAYKKLNDDEQAEKYLAVSAKDDIENGMRNYRALPQLALHMLRKGDIDRAYKYIHRSASDYDSGHATKRQLEMASTLAAIDAAYAEKEGRERTFILLFISTIVVITVCIGLSLRFARVKNRRLALATRQLEEAHSSLQKTFEEMESLNARLEEESRTKEVYIMEFMKLCLSYLGKMESFRASLSKIAVKDGIEGVRKAINSSRYVNKEIKEFFDNFDTSFLSLYPDFIRSLNSLLRPEEGFDEELRELTTELRIYALIWLGIDESSRIAEFLRCSESTVFNYRTRMRNRATVRATFDADVRSHKTNI